MRTKINQIAIFTLLITLSFCTTVYSQSNFKVQLAAFEQHVHLSYFNGQGVVLHAQDKNGFHKYYKEGFANRKEAEQARDQLRKQGFNAIVVNQSLDSYLCRTACAAPVDLKTINHIFFDFDRDELKTASIKELQKLYQVLTENPEFSVSFKAHTDGKGTDDYNVYLSERRAQAAKKYLMDKGIASYRVMTTIHGESLPIAINQDPRGNDSAMGRKYNRRVEIEIYNQEGRALNTVVEPIDVPSSLSLNNANLFNGG